MPSPTSERLWTRAFVMLALANVGSTMIFYLLMPTIASYATAAFGASAGEAGLASSIFLIGGLLGRPLAGFALGRFGLRRSLAGSVAAYLATSLVYLAPLSLAGLTAARLIHGIAFGLAASAIIGAVMSMVPPLRQGEGAGWAGAGVAIGTGLGPFLGLTLLNGPLGMTGVFAAVAGCALATAVLAGLTVRSLPVHVHPSGTTRRAIIEKAALPIGAVVALTAVAFGCILTFLSTYTRGTPLAPVASAYFVVYAATLLLTRPVAGRLQDRRGDDVVLVPALVALIAGVLTTAVAAHPVVLLAGAALLGLGYGTLISAGQAFAVARVPQGRAGVAVASFFLLVDGGTGLGPALLGGMVPLIGFPGVFGLGAAAGTVALVLYLLAVRRTPRLALNP